MISKFKILANILLAIFIFIIIPGLIKGENISDIISGQFEGLFGILKFLAAGYIMYLVGSFITDWNVDREMKERENNDDVKN